jgi:xanthine dehydrogenase accessory factor
VASVHQLSHIARALSTAENECVLATLVSVEGSSFRLPGARMLIQSDHTATGGITAGCLEEDIRQCAFEWTAAGPCMKIFNVGTPEDDVLGWGSGCKGTLRVLLQRIAPRDPMFSRLIRALDQRHACTLATVFDSEARLNFPLGARTLWAEDVLDIDANAAWLPDMLSREVTHLRSNFTSRAIQFSTPGGKFSVFLDAIQPPLHLCVFGSGESVAALLDCARRLGWPTTLCDKRTELYNRRCGLNADRVYEAVPGEFPDAMIRDQRTAAVVMTHHFSDDLSILNSLLNSNIPYVGVLGGRTRSQRLRTELASLVDSARLEKLFGPIGLDIGAADPAEIAVAITGEVLAFMNGRSAGHLADQLESIHAPSRTQQRILQTPSNTELVAC